MNVVRVKSNPDFNLVDLDVSYNAALRSLTVRAGEFRVSSTDYVLKEDEVIQLTPRAHKTSFQVHLVEVDSGEARVLCDEISDFDPPVNFAANNIKDLAVVALVGFEAGSDVADVTVYKVNRFSDDEKAEQEIVDFYKKIGLVG